jgi:hypothetical protein
MAARSLHAAAHNKHPLSCAAGCFFMGNAKPQLAHHTVNGGHEK